MSYLIEYHPKVVKQDIPRLDKVAKKRIKSAIEAKLTSNPLLYGLPLRSTLKSYWKLRVGDYRVVYFITAKAVRVVVIAHRKEVYEYAQKRI